jgi:hypothetical protein
VARTPSQRLAIAANQAITTKFGEQTRPLLPGHPGTANLLESLEAAGIPLDFAERSVARQASRLVKPARTMAYFRAGVFEDWESQCANAAAGAAPRIRAEDQSARRNETRVPPRGPSPPAPDDNVKCRHCGTEETHEQNGRLTPKHRDGCILGVAVATIGGGG